MTQPISDWECLLAAFEASKKTTLANAEVQRLTIEAHLHNALFGQLADESHRPRLERLLRSVKAGAGESAQRKVDLLRDTVLPTLQHVLGLEADYGL